MLYTTDLALKFYVLYALQLVRMRMCRAQLSRDSCVYITWLVKIIELGHTLPVKVLSGSPIRSGRHFGPVSYLSL